MGEKEQGGMLRNVVVLGLIALIAAVITVLVMGLNHKLSVSGYNAANDVDKQVKEYHIKDNGEIDFKQLGSSSGVWNSGFLYYLPDTGNLKAEHWSELRYKVKTSVSGVTMSVDVNWYDQDFAANDKTVTWTAGNVNDRDELDKRFIGIYDENGELIKMLDTIHGKGESITLEPNKLYQVVVKSYNNTNHTLYSKADLKHNTNVRLGGPDDAQHHIKMTDFEVAQYTDDKV